jgi:hypothetical protein
MDRRAVWVQPTIARAHGVSALRETCTERDRISDDRIFYLGHPNRRPDALRIRRNRAPLKVHVLGAPSCEFDRATIKTDRTVSIGPPGDAIQLLAPG